MERVAAMRGVLPRANSSYPDVRPERPTQSNLPEARFARGRALGALLSTAATLALALGGALAATLFVAAPASASLGYEQVTPVDKGGVEPELKEGLRISAGGDTVLFGTRYAMGGTGAQAGPYAPSYVARRGAENWSTVALDPLLSEPFNPGGAFHQLTAGISRDGTRAIVASQQALAPGATEGVLNLYRQDLATGRYRWMASDTTNPLAFEYLADMTTMLQARIVHATADLSRVWMSTPQGIRLSDDPDDLAGATGPTKLYEWSEAGGMQLISRKPEGPPFEGRAFGLYAQYPMETYYAPRNPNHVSADGRQVLLQESQGPGYPQPDAFGLYVRQDGVTRPLSYSRATGADDTVRPVKIGNTVASVDGRYVAFLAWHGDPLTDDAPTGITHGGLYLWDREQPAAQQLTWIPIPGYDGTRAAQILQMSDDGQTLYFENDGTLYVWREGTVREVAAAAGWGPQGSPNLELHPAVTMGDDTSYQASPSGRFFVFPSTASLTGADLRNPACTYEYYYFGLDGYCVEQYVYDAETGEIACASCTTDGSPSRGAVTATWTRMIANDGRARPIVFDSGRVLFDTPNALLADDVNATRDVYAYAAGRHTLISRATPGTSARLMTASDDGTTTLILTDDPIVAQDVDRSRDIYLVREGAGLPAQQQRPDSGARCSGSDCRGPLSAPPGAPPIGSVAFGGSGNVDSAPAPVKASVRVSALKAVFGSAAKLRVRVPRAGRISVAGASIRRTVVSASKAGSYTVRVALRPRAKRSLTKRRTLRVSARVSYRAQGGQSASKTVSVTFKQPKAKRVKTVRSGR
jgi:hypothetical protein